MIVDTSVIIAILRGEPEAPAFLEALGRAERRRLSAGNWIEVSAVTSSRGDDELPHIVSSLLDRLRITIEPVTVEQAQVGHLAYHAFGKGMHPAGLNFGDCFAYALAKVTGEPLLFKGNDFSKTDIVDDDPR